jgi:hypothetical protein
MFIGVEYVLNLDYWPCDDTLCVLIIHFYINIPLGEGEYRILQYMRHSQNIQAKSI